MTRSLVYEYKTESSRRTRTVCMKHFRFHYNNTAHIQAHRRRVYVYEIRVTAIHLCFLRSFDLALTLSSEATSSIVQVFYSRIISISSPSHAANWAFNVFTCGHSPPPPSCQLYWLLLDYCCCFFAIIVIIANCKSLREWHWRCRQSYAELTLAAASVAAVAAVAAVGRIRASPFTPANQTVRQRLAVVL